VPHSVHDRISQLEQLVTSLIGSKETELFSPGTPQTSQIDQHNEDDRPELVATPDRVKFGRDTTTYTNSGHWTSILDGVSLLRPIMMKR
jgi:hypothetical protein